MDCFFYFAFLLYIFDVIDAFLQGQHKNNTRTVTEGTQAAWKMLTVVCIAYLKISVEFLDTNCKFYVNHNEMMLTEHIICFVAICISLLLQFCENGW